MSIFASLPAPDDDGHTDECAIWDKDGDIWNRREDDACDCGQPDAPLIYQGSHILPDELHDKRGGWVDLALIPSHITRDGSDDKPEDAAPWPYLRLGVNNDTVILTRRNVEQIAETLNDWLGSLGAPGKDTA